MQSLWIAAVWMGSAAATVCGQPVLPGTTALAGDADRSEEMRAGIERYLDRELVTATQVRGERWRRDFSSAATYAASIAPQRQRLEKMIGAVEPRVPNPEPAFIATPGTPARVAETDRFTVYAVRWPVYPGVDAEGLLLEPKGKPLARVVAVPDADHTPEMITGLAPGLPPEGQFARRLAENGCQVLVPTLIDRADTHSGSAALNRFTNQPHREWIYRQAFTFGRHIIGYEVHKIQSAIDWFAQQNTTSRAPVGVAGLGEGGLLAFYAAALDARIDAALVSGYFGPREQLWSEPIYRNVVGLLREFGDAEIASLIAPRTLIVEPGAAPEVAGPRPARPGVRAVAAAGRITTPTLAAVRAALERARSLAGVFASSVQLADADALPAFLRALQPAAAVLTPTESLATPPPDAARTAERQRRQIAQLERHTQAWIERSRDVRDAFFWKPVATVTTPDAWNRAMQPLRQRFHDDMGRLPRSDAPLNVRSRLLHDRADCVIYEVVLDVLPDVPLWGYLLLPKSLAPGERRPVIVAQHGLNGTPADLVNEDRTARAHQVYQAFALRLAQRGDVVFAPHFPWKTNDGYWRLQRKAHPLGLSIFSFILADHARLLDWLAAQPFADSRRIGFYGLSWGGKVALRVPALEPRYALSICSGDFNEWIWKLSTTSWGSSYLFAPEPDIFDFGLGLTFGHAEMAAMIAPQPFMVERGHDDGVGLDEWVSFEYAKVRRLYARLGVPERTTIEYFSGVHQIRGVGTFEFIERHFGGSGAAAR